jgi:hypothetical protein
MDNQSNDLEAVNWRAKHPVSTWTRVARWVPAGAGALLLIMAVIIQMNWPKDGITPNDIGNVASITGDMTNRSSEGVMGADLRNGDFIRKGSSFDTDRASSLMLNLASNTQLKINEQSRVTIDNHRLIRLEKGEIWVDVGWDPQLFKVQTPEGTVTVHGTAFTVSLEDSETIVTVERGEVMVENTAEFFRTLMANQQVRMDANSTLSAPLQVNDMDEVMEWAHAIVGDSIAEAKFAEYFQTQDPPAIIAAQDGHLFRWQPGVKGVMSIFVSWDDALNAGKSFSDYEFYIITSSEDPVGKTHRIPGSAFAVTGSSTREIPVNVKLQRQAFPIFVRLVPNVSSGVEPVGLKVEMKPLL